MGRRCVCVSVCVCVCVVGEGGKQAKSRGRLSSNLLRIRFLESVHKKALCSVMDPHLHRATRQYVLRVQILVRYLANSKCAYHWGKSHLCCHIFSIPAIPTHLESHTCTACLTDAALWAWNTFCLHFAFLALLLQDYTHVFLRPEGVSLSSFLLPTVSLVEILHLPSSLFYSTCLLQPTLTGIVVACILLWRPVASNRNICLAFGGITKIKFIHSLNILF